MKVILITRAESEKARPDTSAEARSLTVQGRAQVRQAARRFLKLIETGHLSVEPGTAQLVSSSANRSKETVQRRIRSSSMSDSTRIKKI